MPKPVYKPDSTTPRRGKDSTDAAPVSGNPGIRAPKRVGGHRDGLLEEIETYIHTFIILDPVKVFATAAWVIAAWLIMEFDRFPHFAIYSPVKRCGKTTFLLLLQHIVPRPYNTANISPAAIYRLVDKERPTLLIDEAQSLSESRKNTEASAVCGELLNASTSRHSCSVRCGGKDGSEIVKYSLYSPKVIASIGQVNGVLADRSLTIRMERKRDDQQVKRALERDIDPHGRAIAEKIEEWAEANRERVAEAYAAVEPFNVQNDRLADMLLALQAVIFLLAPDRMKELQDYAELLVNEDTEMERATPEVRLLLACREILTDDFIPTAALLAKLNARQQDDPQDYGFKGEMNAERLASLLRMFDIRPWKKQAKIAGKHFQERGYRRADFVEAWGRYLPTP